MTRQLADSAVSKMETALTLLEQNVRQEGNSATAGKLRQLKEKAVSGQVVLAFCGHFSAGKSTLINRLCGHPLLPSSPIPTSANLVSIGNGGPGAQVTRKIGVLEQSSIVEAIPLEELDAYCINGTDIESVRITYPIPFLGERALLLDTPGIDSTDDAHHMATESALHLADVVFYVMDYNHVQSEVNFAFAKKMKDWGKPLYLIINQIDKHKEYELSFEEYREGAVQAFRNWNIEPDGMLYVTMKEPAHPHNEWEKLRWLVTELIRRGEPLSRYSIDKSVHFLTKEHGNGCPNKMSRKKSVCASSWRGRKERSRHRSFWPRNSGNCLLCALCPRS
jgi:GTP-binding protein EngB required for normal cell division